MRTVSSTGGAAATAHVATDMLQLSEQTESSRTCRGFSVALLHPARIVPLGVSGVRGVRLPEFILIYTFFLHLQITRDATSIRHPAETLFSGNYGNSPACVATNRPVMQQREAMNAKHIMKEKGGGAVGGWGGGSSSR